MKQYYKNLIFTRSDFLDTLVRFGIIKSEKLTTYPLSGIYRNRKQWQDLYKKQDDAQPF